MSHDKKLQTAIYESKTLRFFCWVDVAWPNIKPLMLRFISHLNGANNTETDQAFRNVLRTTRQAIMQIHPSIQIDDNQIDRDYLVVFYRGFFTSAIQELSILHLSNATSQWNPLRGSKTTWKRHNDSPHTFNRANTDKISVSQTEMIGLSDILLTPHDKEVLGEDVTRIYAPYPFKKSRLN